jgi:hypothetical protein
MVQNSFTVNKCIYCDGLGETDEHIIPFALGGKWKLVNACCEQCRDITSRCERNPLSENWAEVRAVLDYPSRRRDFNNETFSLNVTFKNGSKGVLELPKDETLGLTPFLEYPLPAFFFPGEYKRGVIVNAHSLISFGPNVKILSEKYNFEKMDYSVTYKGNNFEKMVTKIAYCATIATFGLDNLEQRFVLPTLLGKKDDIGYWMGCDHDGRITPLIGKQRSKNVIKVGVWQQQAGDSTKYIITRLKFFAASDAPEYIVIVGTLIPDFIPSGHQIFSY